MRLRLIFQKTYTLVLLFLTCSFVLPLCVQAQGPHTKERRDNAHIRGNISSSDKEPVFATVFLKNTSYGNVTSPDGSYHIAAPAGKYILVVSSIGYKTEEKEIELFARQEITHNMVISPDAIGLEEVVVTASGVSRVAQSAYNAVAIDTRALQNTTRNLSNALTRAPGVKLRESGGVGSDTQLMMDGFSGRHVKVFVDGVPLEGVGSSFGLNNIPVNYAERIEVYKGVVPVGFGTDAIGGIVNIVTKREPIGRDRWFLDGSYSYGSFNTHKSYVNFGQTFKNGLTYEINAFQNYSDNNYYVDSKVKLFLEDGTSYTSNELYRVKRFHDTYHNEAAIAKVGVVGKNWADRLMFGVTYSQMYTEIQNGVRQEVVFGGKYREGYTVMPSLEYSKRNLFTDGLDIRLTANYNKNVTDNVDTTGYEFNWFGEKRPRTNPGEQSYQHTRQYNDNWNGTLNLNYRIDNVHSFTFNHTLSSFRRNSESMLTSSASTNVIPDDNRKNVSGLSYRFSPSTRWDMSVFGKHYNQYSAGPVAETSAQDSWLRVSRSQSYTGYGAAGTYFITSSLQSKLSFEEACRMPTDNEMFGDGDLEGGNFDIRPETSHNLNFSLSYDNTFGKHSIYAEGAFVYRNTKDYIMRTIVGIGGGRAEGQHINHGKVLTRGYSFSARYGFSKWLSIGGSITQMNAINNVKTTTNGNPDVTYGTRMPNLPYLFANTDLVLYWHNLGWKGNVLALNYDNLYTHSFSLNFENLGYSDEKRTVPQQIGHNIALSYSIKNGRYNLSGECQNLTDANLYDSFSLQKAGRAFYGKFRIYLDSQ